MKYLGESFDIQTSGRELIFPHHENEIAISGALTGQPPARYWVHCERVLADDAGSAEQARPLDLGDLLEMGYTGKEVRYWLLAVHYRKPVRFSTGRLEDARMSLKRLDTCVHALQSVAPGAAPYAERNQLVYDIKNGFVAAMDDDLNVSAAVASVFRHIRAINILCHEGRIDPESAAAVLDVLARIDGVLKLLISPTRPRTPALRS